MATLKCTIGSFQRVYIIIDALDESTDGEQLLTLIEKIVEWKFGGLHLLATSREEEAIDERLGPRVSGAVALQSVAVDNDIRTYIHETLRTDHQLKTWSLEIQGEIERALVRGAQGM
jgi:hypothetical protein